jgi:MEMO1 family protein
MRNSIIFLVLFFSTLAFAADVKNVDLAGSWYPLNPSQLRNQLQGYLDSANPEKVAGDVFAVISPHAGYQFSGPAAAYGFKALQGRDIKTVVIVGFGHRRFFDGISVYDRGSWRTPLGEIKIDEKLARQIMSFNKRIRYEPALFGEENSVEMEVPFVQMVFKDAMIVPIAFGTQDFSDADILARALAAVLKGRPDVLVVASTDLSHYHPYKEANSIDRHTIGVIKKINGKELYDEAVLGSCQLCGVMPVSAILIAAKMLGFDNIEVLKYTNSGDTFGDKSRVVGYLSAVIYKSSQLTVDSSQKKIEGAGMLNDAQRKRLLQIARESITSYVRDGKKKNFVEKDPVLNQNMGSFVTLHENGNLRGCIGNMVGQGPLYQTVADMAVEAATGDPRFQRLSPQEIGKIDIEISVLSGLVKVKNPDEIKIPGHGVIVRRGFRSGVYLPQVATETGWNKEEFLASLCAHKAGLAPDAWKDPSTEIYVFTAEVFGEKGEAR